MATHLFLIKKPTQSTVEVLLQYFEYAKKHKYSTQIAKQYAIHRRESEIQTSTAPCQFRHLKPGTVYVYDLPHNGKKRIWETPYQETNNKHCNPLTFDRLVYPNLKKLKGVSEVTDKLLFALSQGEDVAFAIHDSLLEFGNSKLAELVEV